MEAATKGAGASMTSRNPEHLWMVVLYEVEERTSELLERLASIGVDTSEASVVRVELSQVAETARAYGAVSKPPPKSVSPVARNAITGAVLGSALGLLAGIGLYLSGVFNLVFAEGLFTHALISAVLGAILGGALGLLWSTAGKKETAQLAPQGASNRDGFLVAVKMHPRVAGQAEEIARRLGAKEILL